MNVSQATEIFGKFKTAFTANTVTGDMNCDTQLLALKKIFIHFPTFLNPEAESKTAAQEIALVRETLEYAVILFARRKQLDDFEAHFHQLQVYFNCSKVSVSERRPMLLGLNLLRLLVCNKISEFHSELERIPYTEHTNLFIRAPILLERYLMEGSYNKLLNARSQVPSNEFIPVVEMLEDTVRGDIANCIPKTYDSLTVVAARKMLMLPSDEAVAEFAEKRGWQKKDASYIFPAPTALPLEESSTGIFGGSTSGSFDAAEGSANRKTKLPFGAQLVEHIALAASLQKVV